MSDTDVIPKPVEEVVAATPTDTQAIIWELFKTLRGPGLVEIQVYRPLPSTWIGPGDFAKRLYLGRASTPLGWVEFSIDGVTSEQEAFAGFQAMAQNAFKVRLNEQMEFNAAMQRQAHINQVAAARAGKGMKHGN